MSVDGAGPCRCLPRIDPMRPTRSALPATRLAGTILLLLTLAACGDRTPAGITALASNALLAEPLEAAWLQFNDPSLEEVEDNCDSAPTLAVALEGWLQGVEAAGLQARFAAETRDARQRVAAIRGRCDAATGASGGATLESPARGAVRERNGDVTRKSAEASRPAITADMLDAYTRGLDEEIAMMRASGRNFVSLAKSDDEGRQVAAKAGLSLAEYRGLRRAILDMLHVRMMHALYAGPAGQARLPGLEPHKREYATRLLAREPFAAFAPDERRVLEARLPRMESEYQRYLELAVVGD